jgi:hypothetical protein
MSGVRSVYLSADALMAQAREDASADDFGKGMFREGPARLLESLERDARLTEGGTG